MTAPDRSRFDQNNRNTIIVVSNADGETPVTLWADPTTHALVTSGGSSGGGGTQYAELITTAPGTGTLALGRYKSSAPTLTDGQMYGLQLDASGNLKVTGSISVGGTTDSASWTAASSSFNPSGGVFNDSAAALTSGQQGTERLTPNRGLHINLRNNAGTEIGTSSNPVRTDPTGSTTQPVSLTSTTITGSVAVTGTFFQATQPISASSLPLPTGAATETTLAKLPLAQASTTSGQSGPLMQGAVTTGAPSYTTAQTSPLSLDTAGNLRTTTVLGAGSAVIGHVITDTGSTTAVTGTVTVSGTVTTTPPSNASTNIAQINGVTPLMGNGVTGTGSQRVTIASDNTAFSVNATLSAETTKVIGVVRNADGAGNLLTSTGNALDINIKSGSIANTSFAATQATASSLNATVTQGPAAALTAGWTVINGEQNDTTGTFTNATQTTSVTATNLAGYGNVLISINGTYGTATAVFEGSDDGGTTWYTIGEAARTDSNTVESGYTTLTNTTRAWQTNNPGWDSLRVRSTAVASGTVNIRISPSAAPSAAGATVQLGSALPTGANVIGAVTQSGTWTNTVTQATASSLNAQVNGPTASGSSLTVNPLTAGGFAKTANPTAVADGQVVNSLHDKLGKQVVVGSIRDLKVNTPTSLASSTAETTVLTAVASTFLDVYGVIVANGGASVTTVSFKDSTGGTTQFKVVVPAGETRGFMLPESGAVKQGTVNNNWTATSSTSQTALDVTMLAVKNI